MKFAKELGSHITPEWRKQYIQYERMKSMLDKHMLEVPDVEHADAEVVDRWEAKFKEQWFHFCEKEMKKITQFYVEKKSEALRKFNSLKGELSNSESTMIERDQHNIYTGERKNEKELKLAFSEFYLSLIIIQDYQKFNMMGFQKIMKKFDKNLSCDNGANWLTTKFSDSELNNAEETEKLIVKVEKLFTNELEKGNRKKAMIRLKVPPFGIQKTDWTSLLVGFSGGCFFVLLVALLSSGVVMHSVRTIPDRAEQAEIVNGTNIDRGKYRSDWQIVTRLYRGPLLVILMVFLLGVNVRGWGMAGVNHKLIFELDPRNHSSHLQIMETAAWLAVMWACSLLLFIFADYISLPAFYSPLCLMIAYLVFFFNPTKTIKYDARRWMITRILRMSLAPLPYVVFADFWVADQFNSLAPALSDLHYFICFYTTPGSTLGNSWDLAVNSNVCTEGTDWVRPILVSLPAFFRFAQCLRRYRDTRAKFPHLVNAGKYSTTLLTNFISYLHKSLEIQAFFFVWCCSKTVSTFYTIFWDLKMDFGFFSKEDGDNKYLREELVYSSTSVYYLAIVEDVVLRFLWMVGVTLKKVTGVPPEAVNCVLQIFEVFRRFVWNFFRLENEHLNNCGHFRVVRDISIAPVDMKDQEEILTMMDFPDGAQQVRRRRKELGK